ncbi:MAG: hypothetical protein R6W82_00170 [bacterium]
MGAMPHGIEQIPDALLPLLAGAAAAGLFHAFLAGHWLPLVVAGRAHGWTTGRTVGYAMLSSAVHIGLTLVLGAVVALAGHSLLEEIEHTVHAASGGLLVAAGTILFIMALVGWDPLHRHAHEAGRKEHGEECGEAEGRALAVLLGLHPNVAALALVLAAAATSLTYAALAFAVFCVTALFGIAVAVFVGLKGMRHLPGDGESRGGKIAISLALAAVGFWILVL